MAQPGPTRSAPFDACPYVLHGALELCPAYEAPDRRAIPGTVQFCRHMSPVLTLGERRAYTRCLWRTQDPPSQRGSA